MKLLNGTGYTMHQGPDGFYLDIDFPDPIVTLHPFYVTLFKDGSTNKFKVEPGTVNSFMPTLDGTKLDVLPAPSKTISATSIVYLKCQYSASGAFPYTVTVESGSTLPADEDEFAYVRIAGINITSGVASKTSQDVQTSLYGERLKCGTSTAEYFFSRA
jgi:hypothetical protein